MSYKQYRRRRRERSLQQQAICAKHKYEAQVDVTNTRLVPHPTVPKTFIVVPA